MAANDLRLQRTVAGARRRTRKERAAVVATEVIAPEPEADAPAAAPAEDEPLTRAESDGAARRSRPAAKKRQARSR